MSYEYSKMKHELLARPDFPAELARIKERIDQAIEHTGAMTYEAAMKLTHMSESWLNLAAIDYLVENRFYQRVERPGFATQDQILAAGPRRR